MQLGLIAFSYASEVRDKHIPALFFTKDGGACSAFACAQYDQSFFQRSLSSANDANTRITVMSQKRNVILLSGMFNF